MRKLPKIETLVVKVGSNILTHHERGVNLEFLSGLVRILCNFKKNIPNIVVVSSGAVGAGFKLLGFSERPQNITDKQACAAVGQARLIWEYDREFEKYGVTSAQILITKDDLSNRRRYLNARYTLRRLLELGVVPVINENDSVVIEELRQIENFTDNDNLSALVSGLIGADMLLILSDVDGLFDKDPFKNKDAKRIEEVKYINEELLNVAGDSVSGVGTGGMKSKLEAAGKALDAGCHVGIINGMNLFNVEAFLNGEDVGTFFNHIEDPLTRRKHWIAYAAGASGELHVDNGAVNALVNKKTSLLPSGVTKVTGHFGMGDVVAVIGPDGKEVARGKVRYASEDADLIKGKKSSDISSILGYKFTDEIIHRDDLVVTTNNGA
ncbi:glutamate 5-kinase [Denitrovibrio acetiphilus DSM 12809]|uniref:Glutamate 5-kinase n=1 Tax=Denitrovibrio acetiphilus (strain DSM 12809 / NBRC 114555 / N2460) TaxID=522772 RepID=D4H0Y9_DENA2|nr:glutamate 5-kinase [Denitrovibrio acetiphilus]ADD68652.1 glutamate 5-kinase [Denitrovibrio acetiphilus DSM 12809]